MYDGTIKMVQDIKIGDKLMGDDSTGRNVLSLARGEETMYKVIPVKGDSYTVNESHILSLISTTDYGIKIKKNQVIDISVKEYLKLPKTLQGYLKGYKVPVDFPTKEIELDAWLYGYWLGDGSSNGPGISTQDSAVLYYFIKNIPKDTYITYVSQYDYRISGVKRGVNRNSFFTFLKKNNLIKNKHIIDNYKYNSRKTRLELLAGILDADGHYHHGSFDILQKNERLLDDIVFLARSLGFSANKTICQKSCTYKGVKKTGTYYRSCISGVGNIIPCKCPRKQGKERKQIKDVLRSGIKLEKQDVGDYYGFEIDGNRRFLLGDFTVTHNTITAIYIASMISMKTIVVIKNIVLIKQWKESIEKFCPTAKVQALTPKSKMDKDAHFYIMNAINIPKMYRSFFKDIGLVIVDEVHLIVTRALSLAFQYLAPKYCLALSATPERPDGMDVLIDVYFGSHRIFRKLNRKHIAYRIDTGFKPVYDQGDWNAVLNQQAESERHNGFIFKIVEKFKDRNFLMLCKRVGHAKYLCEELAKRGEKVCTLVGTQKDYDPEARILIGTVGKVGVGFDHPKLNALIIAGDVEEYFIQYLGRVMRTREGEPLIFDLVDNNASLKRHYYTRSKIYREHGGIIRKLVFD